MEGRVSQSLVVVSALQPGLVIIFNAESLAKSVGPQAGQVEIMAGVAHQGAGPVRHAAPLFEQMAAIGLRRRSLQACEENVVFREKPDRSRPATLRAVHVPDRIQDDHSILQVDVLGAQVGCFGDT